MDDQERIAELLRLAGQLGDPAAAAELKPAISQRILELQRASIEHPAPTPEEEAAFDAAPAATLPPDEVERLVRAEVEWRAAVRRADQLERRMIAARRLARGPARVIHRRRESRPRARSHVGTSSSRGDPPDSDPDPEPPAR